MRKKALPPLTGIRFYAALFVFLSHAPIVAQMDRLTGERLLFNAGVVGVSFFFVLSGFILTYNYVDLFRVSAPFASYRRFVWDRLTKIYPVHLLALLVVFPVAVFSPNLPLKWSALPVHLLLLQCFWPSTHPTFYNYLNVPSWSISCEWFFYLIAPVAIFLVMGNLQRRLLLLATLAAYVAVLGFALAHYGSDFERLYFASWFAPSRAVEFIAGVFLGRVFLSGKVWISHSLAGVMQFAGLALIIAGAIYRHAAPWPFWGGLLYLPGSMLLVFSLTQGNSRFANHLSTKFLQTLGTASYSFYLLHAPILRTLKGVTVHFGWSIRFWWALWPVLIALFIFVQCIAVLVCYRYEIPSQNRLRRLLRDKPEIGNIQTEQGGYAAGA